MSQVKSEESLASNGFLNDDDDSNLSRSLADRLGCTPDKIDKEQGRIAHAPPAKKAKKAPAAAAASKPAAREKKVTLSSPSKKGGKKGVCAQTGIRFSQRVSEYVYK